ncbi:MAG: septum formation initiator family protein [Desulfovibrionaceae bacterium]
MVVLNLFLVFRLLCSDEGVFAYRDLKAQYTALETQVEELRHRSLELSKEIRLLKSDRPYIEKMIRQQMNFVDQDEILYVFPDTQQEARPGAGQDEHEN